MVTNNSRLLIRCAGTLAVILITATYALSQDVPDAADPATESADAPAKPRFETPFSRLLNLPGRAVRAVGSATGWAADTAKDAAIGALDTAREVRDGIRKDGFEGYMEKRIGSYLAGKKDAAENLLLSAGDLAHGNAAQVADSLDKANEALEDRRRAAKDLADRLNSLGNKLDAATGAIDTAARAASNPNPDEQRREIAALISDMVARASSTAIAAGETATTKELLDRVMPEFKERTRDLPPGMHAYASKILATSISKATAIPFNLANKINEPPKPQPAVTRLTGSGPWQDPAAKRTVTLSGTIDLASQSFEGKCSGRFNQNGNPIWGEFRGHFGGNEKQGHLEGTGDLLFRYQSKEGPRVADLGAKSPFQLRAEFVNGAVTGEVFNKELRYPFRLQVQPAQ